MRNNKFRYKFTFVEKQDGAQMFSSVIVYGDSLEQGMFKLVTILGKDRAISFKLKSIEELSDKKPLAGLHDWDRGQTMTQPPYTSDQKLDEALATLESR